MKTLTQTKNTAKQCNKGIETIQQDSKE